MITIITTVSCDTEYFLNLQIPTFPLSRVNFSSSMCFLVSESKQKKMHRIITRKYSSFNSPDFEPHSVLKVITKSNGIVSEHIKVKDRVVIPKKAVKNEIVQKPKETKTNRNEMGIQMISRSIFQQIFNQTKNERIESVKIEK